MAKIYFKKSLVSKTMKPRKEVVSFLLNYSKAVTMIEIGNTSFEIISN
jgi:hypothetical protein